ncbi:CaiB/BaiF CoA-transferase family protein [Amycolatopsis methanolica]|uniref:Formyl-coenzyme A transferase n=1 Tax=Amycolatopsis methanolica 239 TaxID=1068978 RepID=A0A076N0H6_AMYME|nr:CoA transferase [Amycolatopsis methanolica]AIJ23312.1 formyl-coenzyme A transferase [Amycolatopsis methanolica 239]
MVLPLDEVRVLDLTDGLGESCGRYLADLGAEVVRVEPPGGSRSRRAEPVVDGVSIPFALRNANKLGVTLDPRSGRLRELIRTADILIASGPVPAVDDHPALVTVSITPFGLTGPYRDWVATEEVLYALSGVLSRSGAPGAPPLLPPAGLVEGTVGVHAAWAALLAYHQRCDSGIGQEVDVSAFEAMVHGFDPAFGTQGTAAAGRAEDFPRGRPDAANFYPVFRCRDGHVRICLLAKRQWRAMFSWLGEPAEFADPKYDTIPARFAAADRLHPLIARLFAGHTRDELVAEGAARGVPVGGVLGVREVLAADHFAESGALTDFEIAPGVRARVPSGYLTVDGERAGLRTRAPAPGEHNDIVPARPPVRAARGEAPARPLDGVRVLDLGVIVFGAELSRHLADYGADVIKIENADFPDGLRQSRRGSALAASVAWGHRNKRSLGLNLRTPEGREIFLRLAASADVVLANFKPGTLASMGLGYRELSTVNPRIVLAESSAFGNSGPWRTRLGYGPLVRASCGVSALWRYPGEEDRLCDGSTVYPDHIAAGASAVAVLAALIRRRRTGAGAVLDLAQADTALVHLGHHLALESLRPGAAVRTTAWVHACAGDDEWCVVAPRDHDDVTRLAKLIERPGLAEDPGALGRALADWLAARSPRDAAKALQEAGVPAGAMVRLPELLTDPHLRARRSYTTLEHDLLPKPLPAVARAAVFPAIADPPGEPAPVAGRDTVEICESLLGMRRDEIDRLIAAGVLQPAPLP